MAKSLQIVVCPALVKDSPRNAHRSPPSPVVARRHRLSPTTCARRRRPPLSRKKVSPNPFWESWRFPTATPNTLKSAFRHLVPDPHMSFLLLPWFPKVSTVPSDRQTPEVQHIFLHVRSCPQGCLARWLVDSGIDSIFDQGSLIQ